MKTVFRAAMLCTTLALAGVAHADVDPAYKEAQEKADARYEAGDYRKAYRTYEDLAEVGDSFAQYRVSTMNLYGKGVDKDPVEAFAWSVLAAQSKHDDIVQYRDLLWEALEDDEQKKAKKRADKLMDKYSNVALAEKARKKTRRRLSSCTGSRLSTRCEDVYIADPVIGSGIAPGGGGLAGGGEPEFSGHDRTNQSPGVQKEGGPARDFEYFLGLRETLKQLDTYIEEHSGTVTLGEFELVDPPTDERS